VYSVKTISTGKSVMFTGIVREVGTFVNIVTQGQSARVTVRAPQICVDAELGDSICTNGVCLTASELSADSFIADVSSETLNRTALSTLQPGDPLNLEPALRPSDRLGGHIVSGHVDGVGTIETIAGEGEFWRVIVRFPRELERYIAVKGSLTVDGISLTVADLDGDRAGFALIPHTIQNTNLRIKRPGSTVNLEVDVLARYLERLLLAGPEERGSGLTAEKLQQYGY